MAVRLWYVTLHILNCFLPIVDVIYVTRNTFIDILIVFWHDAPYGERELQTGLGNC
jgi:hypothetical protein